MGYIQDIWQLCMYVTLSSTLHTVNHVSGRAYVMQIHLSFFMVIVQVKYIVNS